MMCYLIICHSDYYYSIGVAIVQLLVVGLQGCKSLIDKYVAQQ